MARTVESSGLYIPMGFDLRFSSGNARTIDNDDLI